MNEGVRHALARHSREGGNPALAATGCRAAWIPAFAGMTHRAKVTKP